MLAEFDSDSDTESNPIKISRPIPKLDFTTKSTSTSETRQPNHHIDSSDDSDDADGIIRPKGRMAARMQASAGVSEPKENSAFSRLTNALRKEQEQAKKKSSIPEESSEDDLPAAASNRRSKGKASQSPAPSDQSRRSPSRARSASPLFVFSPTPPRDEPNHDRDANGETEEQPKSNARFLALVAQKRKEREEREKIEAEQKAAKRAQMELFSSEIFSGEDTEADDPQSAQKLSQKGRKPRKASKKALEEMSRETQRMSRNMQLAHQAQTKKKISKESFFARFNFMQPDAPTAEAPIANSSSTAGSQHSSDGEVAQKKNDTPHTSPVLGPSDTGKPTTDIPAQNQSEEKHNSADTTASSLEEAFIAANDAPKELKEPLIGAPVSSAGPELNATKPKLEPRKTTKPSVRVLMSRHHVAQHNQDGSDSDDLEVITSPAKARRIAAFENLPSRKMQEPTSMTRLKALAHLTSPTRKTTSMTSAELSASLLYRARQQAAKERREHIDELRAKGIVVETAEERAAMEDDVENLVEKARQEADEIARQERAARKNAQGLNEDDEDDDDFVFSGTDDDASGEDDHHDDDGKSVNGQLGFLDREADENDDSADEQSELALSDVEEEAPASRRNRRTRVVSDDDEEEEEPQVPSTPVRPPSNAPQSAQRPQFPGMQTPNMSMGLTQAFAGTLADEDGAIQSGSATAPFSLPDPGRPVPRLGAEESEILVRDSQEQSHEPDFMSNYNQSIARVSESPATHRFSQYSQLPDPTQDEGFVFSPFDPAKRFKGTPPVSTVDTVLVGQSQSPVAKRKRKQLRRGRAAELSVVEEEDNEGDFEINANAFNVMKKATKRRTVLYDKKNSKAKDIVDEAAEESEDEYAGVGGASDESDGEENAYDRQMINDQSGEVADEQQLAALNAYVTVTSFEMSAY